MYSLPSEGTTNWKPGVTYNGGFPARNTIYATLSPLGGTQDDTAQVQAALDGAGALATDEQHAQVVKLNPGTFRISGQGLSMRYSYVTLRGSGPGTTCWNNQVGNGTPTAGTPCTASDGTRLIKADRATNFNYAVLYVGGSDANLTQGDGVSVNGTAWNLALDANKDSYSVALTTNPGIAVGEFLLIDHLTWNATLSPGTNLDPQVFWLSGDPNNQHDMGNTVSTNGSRRWMVRQDRSINQIIEVTATALDSQGRQVLTFATPLHWNFKTAYAAQVVRYATPFKKWIGIEELYLFGGMNADWHGNSTMQQCAYCWYKHIESHWGAGGIELFGTYRSEVRDSYLHESWNETYGGDGYLLSLNYGASDNLVENNIMWKGNKVIVMRGTGGGNVAAYNYMEDAYGYNYPDQVEAGVNAGHYCTPHYELLEGNYAQNFQGDVRWGASAHITVFRNHLTMLRRGYGPLANYTFGADVYKDLWGRSAVRMERYMYWTNLVANVMGMSGQQLLSHPGLFTQTGWIYEIEAGAGSDPGTNVPVYWVGMVGSNAGLMPPDTQVLATTIRDANFDYVSNQVHWHGLGGKGVNNDLAPPANSAVPSSLYLQSKPAFFGSYTWPWVDPTGPTKTYTLPAKARFDAGTPNVVP